MKKQLLLLYVSMLPCIISADTSVWNGFLPVQDYIDENILITDNTWLAPDTTVVEAFNQDVTIIVSQESKVYSNDSGSSTLILRARYPWTITIKVEKSLKFEGVAGVLDQPIIIQEEGNGSIEWIVEEGETLTFGSGNNRGGTLLLLYYDGEVMPSHTFKPRLHHEQIRFERHSKWGHRIVASSLSAPALEQFIVIDALNKTDDHNVHIEFYDGSGFMYEQRFPNL